MKSVFLMFCLSLLSMTVFAQNEHAGHGLDHSMKMDHQGKATQFKDPQATTIYQHYLALKDALVESDQEAAKSAAQMLEESLQQSKADKKLTGPTEAIAGSDALAKQRSAFSELSNAMTQWVKQQEISEGEVYLEYCPMANSNKGGYWLSNESEIKNPYFGKMMLSCGKVAETIH